MFYFYPRSPCGERPGQNLINGVSLIFLSTLSLRRATAPPYNLIIQHAFLSTLSLRRATPGKVREVEPGFVFLSTLSLRRATNNINSSVHAADISIHALLAESDSAGVNSMLTLIHFYPRSPCGERHHIYTYLSILFHFYPRSPCGERQWEGMKSLSEVEFLSTLSLRRATT